MFSRLRPNILYPARRLFSTSSSPTLRRSLKYNRILAGCTAVGLVAGVALVQNSATNDDQESIGSLIRTYSVYKMCSFPSLVDASPGLLSFLMKVPIVSWIAKAVVRITFFDQFVGGDTALETVPVLRALRKREQGALFAYSVEVDEDQSLTGSSSAQQVEEMINCIDVAADFEDSLATTAGRRTWVAVKMTALLPDASALVRFSSYIIAHRQPLERLVLFPGHPRPSDLDVLTSGGPTADLSEEDIKSLRQLYADMVRICERGQKRNVRLILDAEYSWYQPAIDAIQLSLMRRFNKTQPLIYGTFQAYLRRTPAYLALSIEDARKNGYMLGVKLVRGAYHESETREHEVHGKMTISPDILPPVWGSKKDTDTCYDACANVLLDSIAEDMEQGSWTIATLFGTHNWTSADVILDGLVSRGLAKKDDQDRVVIGDQVAERVTFGQLYGMGYKLADYVVGRTVSSVPMLIKYVPYGALSEVMPYLGRRAIENKSMLGNGTAHQESKRAKEKIWRRLMGN